MIVRINDCKAGSIRPEEGLSGRTLVAVFCSVNTLLAGGNTSHSGLAKYALELMAFHFRPGILSTQSYKMRLVRARAIALMLRESLEHEIRLSRHK
jgi:hypothetical protein